MSNTGRLIILSGPSGAGKSTLVKKLLEQCPLPLQLSVSATTRKQRVGEVDGRDYHFVSHEQFEAMRKKNAFLEYKEVFGRGDWYGTPQQQVEEGLRDGKWIILEIDVQGAIAVLEKFPDAISLFVHPGSLEELEIRLRRRGTDSEASIQRRLEVAAEELQALHRYRYEVVNREVVDTVKELCHLLQQHQ